MLLSTGQSSKACPALPHAVHRQAVSNDLLVEIANMSVASITQAFQTFRDRNVARVVSIKRVVIECDGVDSF